MEYLNRQQNIDKKSERFRCQQRWDFQQISSLMTGKLAKVEKLFEEMLKSNVTIISEIGQYICQSGGKRIRPLVHLLSSAMCGYKGERDVLFAAIFEAIHTATLVHDDIIDNAHTRRGKEAINTRWGNTITVLLGDYIYIKSVLHALQDGNLKIMNLIAETTMNMIEGELMEEDAQRRIDLTEEEYLEIVKRKTAALFSDCCAVAGIISNSSEEEMNALRNYGRNLGMAFQLADDLLDFTADEKTLGKPVASDLKEGRLTLPIIYLLKLGHARHRKLITSIIKRNEASSESFDEVVRIAMENGVINRTRRKALAYAKEAKASLHPFKASLYREALFDLTDLIVYRTR